MRLKNKISGEIKEFALFDGNELQGGATLESLTKEWEDYEELKGYWYINEFGTPTEITHIRENIFDKQRKNFGNYFETEEEAEKAAEKLKAWKRLKDTADFKFTGFEETDRGCLGDFTIYCYIKSDGETPYGDVEHDLDLLFGGEE